MKQTLTLNDSATFVFKKCLWIQIFTRKLKQTTVYSEIFLICKLCMITKPYLRTYIQGFRCIFQGSSL